MTFLFPGQYNLAPPAENIPDDILTGGVHFMKTRSIVSLLLCLVLLAGAAAAVEVETVSVSALTGTNGAPVARNLSLKTYRGVSVGGSFQAVDPEGDPMSFRVSMEPEKGSVTVEGDRFVYTPDARKRGKDRFTYQAVDREGNLSGEAEVTIRIEKQEGRVSYPELKGSGLQYAATRLAEAGVFTGQQVGSCYCFDGDAVLTRGDFLTMCAALTGMEPLEDVTRTGFSDDDSITLWQKPYVSAALLYGVVKGSTEAGGRVVFRAGDTITRAEAAVMLNSFLDISDAAGAAGGENVPDWAAQAVANLYSCEICSGTEFQSDRPLTRGDAAEMFSGALDLLAARGKGSRFSWSA